MLRRVVWKKFTDVLEMLTASIALIVEVVSTSVTSVISATLHGATSQKTAIFKFLQGSAAVPLESGGATD
jgi:hypothetical protein